MIKMEEDSSGKAPGKAESWDKVEGEMFGKT